jgi:hypothetical protein
MKKQGVLAALLIFLFAACLMTAGLWLTERGLREVSGRPEPSGALRLEREGERWTLIFAGTPRLLPQPPWR